MSLTLVLLEAAFRVLHVAVGTVQINRRTVRRSANPRLGFELRPGASVRAEVDYQVNSHGMRDHERPLAKPPGGRRIAVIGDSIAFGYWVAEEDAFPHQLERRLRAAPGGEGVEVLNFGVPGSNLSQEIELLRERALAFAPDLVVLALCLNDLEGPDSYEHGLVVDRVARSGTWTGRLSELLLDHSRLFAWVEYRRAELQARREFVRARDPWAGPLYAEPLEEQERALASRFGVLAALLRARSVPGLVALFPSFGQPFARYRQLDFHRAAAKAAAGAGLASVDLLECYRPYAFRDVRVDVVHPSPLGHRIAAHGIADALCTLGWPCPATPPRCTDYRKGDFPVVRGY